MTSVETDGLVATRSYPRRVGLKSSYIAKFVTTTDPKQLGIVYLFTPFSFFFGSGLMALLLRAELGSPGLRYGDQPPARPPCGLHISSGQEQQR
ncbi:hypothetical protein ACQP0C_13625 [Nocardia sp. CA-129566]|uniref:hypothetical protein n=1 Tax=Nocardia sp. CA-129566 TaxID=3239976 RepID=UPI003D967999